MNLYWNDALALLPASLLISVLFSFTPYLTRHSEAFGVSVPPSEYRGDALTGLRRRYRNQGFLLGAVCLVLLFAAGILWKEASELLCSLLLLLQLALYFMLYLRFHRLAAALKAQLGWTKKVNPIIAVDLSPDSRKYLSPRWLLLFPAVILLTAVLGYAFYPGAPENLALSWKASGFPPVLTVLRTVPKSDRVIWMVLFLQAMLSALMTFCFFMIQHARRQYDAENFEESVRRVNYFRRACGVFLLSCGVALNLIFLMMLMGILEAVPAGMMFVGPGVLFLLILAGAVYLSFQVGQGGSRVKLPSHDAADCISLQDDDRFWKLGAFYYNPDDPAVFVEKRFGVGWTCNFARPMSWVCLGGLLVFIAVSIFLSIRMTG